MISGHSVIGSLIVLCPIEKRFFMFFGTTKHGSDYFSQQSLYVRTPFLREMGERGQKLRYFLYF